MITLEARKREISRETGLGRQPRPGGGGGGGGVEDAPHLKFASTRPPTPKKERRGEGFQIANRVKLRGKGGHGLGRAGRPRKGGPGK
jgi:hypothetical protein